MNLVQYLEIFKICIYSIFVFVFFSEEAFWGMWIVFGNNEWSTSFMLGRFIWCGASVFIFGALRDLHKCHWGRQRQPCIKFSSYQRLTLRDQKGYIFQSSLFDLAQAIPPGHNVPQPNNCVVVARQFALNTIHLLPSGHCTCWPQLKRNTGIMSKKLDNSINNNLSETHY